jgi:hypothetical protein
MMINSGDDTEMLGIETSKFTLIIVECDGIKKGHGKVN